MLPDDENVNAWMVKQGHAWASRESSLNVSYCACEDARFFATGHSNASTASCMRELREAPIEDD